jgi:hypothetical protein
MPLEVLTWDTPNISDLSGCAYYDWVWYCDPINAWFHVKPHTLGRWLGCDRDNGPAMCYKVLKPNGHWIVWSSCTVLEDAEKRDPVVNDHMAAYSVELEANIGKYYPSFILEEDMADVEAPPPLNDTEDESDLPPLGAEDGDLFDPLLNTEIILHQGDGISLTSIQERKRTHDGSPIGRKNKNPLLDSRIYIVKLPDGEMKDVAYNFLAEHFFICEKRLQSA